MDITITGRGVEIPDRFEDYATEKADKVAHLADKALALEIRVIRHHETGGSTGSDRVELTLIGPGPIVRAEAAGLDKYAAFDIAMDKLLERLRQAKDRRKVHHGQHAPASMQQTTSNGRIADLVPASPEVMAAVATGEIPIVLAQEDAEWTPVVIRNKVFPESRMTPEDALDHMELVGHDFFLFVDSVTDRPSVVYRRKGWQYGVISLEAQVDEVAARRRR
ncbi:MAG: ribosome-associated translation inhibitor RaiA [Pseudolysinimonas sp.]|uniref:ribosome hibernation-promoting factor, HPF/YfiA family n=1 Tax=Pseudolysinimonas sp. TaxID=2680009 RepID=UPI00326762C8